MADGAHEYRRRAHTAVPAWRRWWPLARQEFGGLFASRWGVALFALCLLPAVGRLILLLIVFGVIRVAAPGRGPFGGRRSELALNPEHIEFYFDHVLQPLPGMVFWLLLATLVVARAVAKDRATNALELYWTRGITPFGYLFAKWLGTTLLLMTMTVLAPLLLWGGGVLLADDWQLLQGTWLPMLRAGLGLAVVTAIWSAIGILISAAAASPNSAMVVFTVLWVGSRAIGLLVARLTGNASLLTCGSVWDAGGAITKAIAGVPQRDANLFGAVVLSVGLLLVTSWRARARLVTAEIVA